MVAGVQGFEPCSSGLESDASPQCLTPVGERRYGDARRAPSFFAVVRRTIVGMEGS